MHRTAPLRAHTDSAATGDGLATYCRVAAGLGMLVGTALCGLGAATSPDGHDPGARTAGRLLTAAGGTLGALGAINISGLVLSDFFNAHGVDAVGLQDTVAVFEAATSSPGLVLWSLVGRVGAMVGIPLLFLGLSRAGVIGWWAAPLFLAGGIAPYVVPGPWAIPAVLVTSLPGIVLGLIIARRGAAAVVAVEAGREPGLV